MQSPFTGKPIKLPASEILKSLPEIFGVRLNEEPSYDVIESDGEVEIRRYETAILASVTVSKEFDDFREEAFKRLAAYIFGENDGGKKLAMTSPVLQEKKTGEKIPMTAPVIQTGGGNQWTMSFVLPKKFASKKPPSPIDPSVTLKKVETRTLAAIRYKGNNTERRMSANRMKLEAWLKAHSHYEAVGDIFWAQYDAPFVIPFLKTNEALVEVRLVQ
jgi:hypothetical protein